MQVELSKANQQKVEKYRDLIREGMMSFNPSVTTLVNEAVATYFEDAIALHLKICKKKK